ncbi:ABC transporter substrate-binding protein [Cuneatibacter sp. NSJ-177]|uniref:ABC transporter substrate-binding protein n=1 Tax=Cuneatibacter sp. NSJ-177 TaxID=2931401 RepID=UPI001FD0BE98|nr:ABC transporter substrate-binding protein [Cuneatibacter sp. NSJ-177]MCJ7836303.1 ABC transporter substrate-binding protein [Cuneatibacter sp. NSJ-177]
MKKRAWLTAGLISLSLIAGCGGSGASATTGAEAPAGTEAGSTSEVQQGRSGGVKIDGLETVYGKTKESAKDTFNIAMYTDAGTFIPYKASPSTTALASSFVLERLGLFDSNQEVVCTLAESYEYSEDGNTLIIHLRKGVLFNDGTEMKASDVVYSYQNVFYGTSIAAQFQTYVDFDNIKATGDYTVELPLTTPVPYAHEILVQSYVFSEAYMEKMGDRAGVDEIVGTGPYVVEEYVSGDHVTLKKNESYWDQSNPPRLETVNVRFIAEASVALIEMEKGNIDFIFAPTATEVDSVLAGNVEGAKVIECDSINTHNLIFNNSNTATADIRVRQAIGYAIDLEAINEVVFNGIGYNSTSLIAKDHWAHNTELDANPLYVYNPEKAKELLKEAGYESGLTLKWVGDSSANHTAEFEVIQSYLSAVGIEIDFQNYDRATASETIKNTEDWSLTILDMGMSGEPYGSLAATMNDVEPAKNTMKVMGLPELQEYTDLLNETRMIRDFNERALSYQKAMKIWMEGCYNFPIHDLVETYVASENLEGLVRSSLYCVFNYCYFD